MNKLLKILGFIVILLSLALVITSCGETAVGNYTVTFLVDDTKLCDVKSSDGETVKLPASPTRSGYDFVGWVTDEGSSFDEKAHTSGDITVYAKWSPIEYKVAFIADSTTVTEVGYTLESESIEAPEVPEKAGYNGEWESFTLGAEDITVNAVYTLMSYKISYETNLNGISGGTLLCFTVESDNITLFPLESDEFNFIGWYTDENMTVKADDVIPKGTANNIHLYAKLECIHSYSHNVTREAEILKDGIRKYTCN